MGGPMLDGVKIKVGGEDMTLPPLNWKAARKFFKNIVGGSLEDPEQAVDLMPELLFAALARNYPDLTQSDLEDRITPGEVLAAIPALLEVSGFTPAAPGEAKRGRVASRTGTGSPPASSRPPAGRGTTSTPR